AARWLQRNDVDPRSVEWPPMVYPDVYAAMQNRGVDIGFSTEPLVTAGITRGVHAILATQEEMYPTTSRLFAVLGTSVDRHGPQRGPSEPSTRSGIHARADSRPATAPEAAVCRGLNQRRWPVVGWRPASAGWRYTIDG